MFLLRGLGPDYGCSRGLSRLHIDRQRGVFRSSLVLFASAPVESCCKVEMWEIGEMYMGLISWIYGVDHSAKIDQRQSCPEPASGVSTPAYHDLFSDVRLDDVLSRDLDTCLLCSLSESQAKACSTKKSTTGQALRKDRCITERQSVSAENIGWRG